MATFWKEIENIYGTQTYQDTKNTYDWVVKALQKGNFDCKTVHAEFLFNVSGLLCSCVGIEEFVENAYNQEGYSLTDIHFRLRTEDRGSVNISVKYNDIISVSTDSKVMLERVVNFIENTTLDETEVNDPISVTYVETQINNDGVIVHGDGNIIANDHGEIEVEKEKKESGSKTFWKGVFQNIASNIIWYLLSLAAGGLLAYFLTN